MLDATRRNGLIFFERFRPKIPDGFNGSSVWFFLIYLSHWA
jgi:hypothetical protein